MHAAMDAYVKIYHFLMLCFCQFIFRPRKIYVQICARCKKNNLKFMRLIGNNVAVNP